MHFFKFIFRKTNVIPSKHHRHRSYTISSKLTPLEKSIDVPHTANDHATTKANWCGYDSMLHAKICSTNNFISNPVLAAHTSKLLHNYNSNNNSCSPNNGINNRSSRSRHRHHHNEFPISGSPQVQGYTKLTSTQQNNKLNTNLLNQLNPQLTQEQKLTRTMNHVEKWLADEHITAAASIVTSPNMLDAKNIICKDTNLYNNKTDDNLNNATAQADKVKESERMSRKINEIASPSKKIFNKAVLIDRKTPKSSLSSSQRNSSTSDTQTKGTSTATPPNNVTLDPKEMVMEYASIPIAFDPSHSECENLLRASSDESSSQIGMTDDASMATIHRYVHIHHHYYHH